MTQYRIGSCSICGGDVVKDRNIMLVGPPPPGICRDCGATEDRGPTIPMKPRVVPQGGDIPREFIDNDESSVRNKSGSG